MPNSAELAVVIPVYNEEGAIESVVRDWVRELERLGINFQIHAYNDGSKDGTAKILGELARSESRLCVHNKENSGHGPTILQGYRENCDKEWIFQIDSDDEMKPSSFAQLWERRQEFDILVGERDRHEQPLSRQVVSAVSRMTVRLFFGSAIFDVNTPYRLMRSATFQRVFNAIPEDTFAPNVAVTGAVSMIGARAFRTSVPQFQRQTGEVSIQRLKLARVAIKAFWQTIKARSCLRRMASSR